MKRALRSRLIALEMAIAVVVVLLCVAGYQAITVSFRREKAAAGALRKSLREFDAYQVQFYAIASHLEAEIGNLNQALLRFAIERDQGGWSQFQGESQGLTQWIREQKAGLPAGKTVDLVPAVGIAVDFASLLDEIDKTYARYLESARQIPSAIEKSVSSTQRLRAVEPAMAQSQKLLALAGRARATGESVKLVAVSQPSFPWHTAWIPALMLIGVVVLIFRPLVSHTRRRSRRNT